MQPQCIGQSGLRSLVVLVAILAATARLHAQEASPSPSPSLSPTPFSLRIDTSISQKPVFYQDDGRSLEVMARLGYKLSPSISLGLWQAFTYNKKVEAPAESNVYAEDTLLQVVVPEFHKLANDQLKITAVVQDLVLANNPTTRRNGLKNALSGQLISALTTGPLETTAVLSVSKGFYEETFNRDGKPNPKHTFAYSIVPSYAITEKVGASITYIFRDRTLYHREKHAYLFEFNPEVGYQMTDKLGIFAGLNTSDAYLKEFGGVEADYIYQEDLSQFYLRVECTL